MLNVRAQRLTRWARKTTFALAALCSASLLAQVPPSRDVLKTDVEVGYLAERSLRAASNQNFWMQGGSAEAGSALWHGIGPAVNVAGAHANSIGASGIPLSLITVVAGPRVRVGRAARFSPYVEALFGIASGFGSIFPNPGGATSVDASFALQAGGGLDIRTGKHLFVRAVDASYIRTQLHNGTSNTQNILHVSGGLGLRF